MNLRWMLEVRGEQAVEINLATTSTAMRSSYILGCFCLLLLYLNVRLTTCALKVSKPKVWCYMMWCASMMCHSSRWNPHGLSLQYSIPSWNVRMPAPCPVPVITASSDTQNRLYKPARLPVRCLSGAKQGEIDPSMDHRNRFWGWSVNASLPLPLSSHLSFQDGHKVFVKQVADMRHSFSTCHSRGSRKLRRPDCAKPRAKRSLDGMKWSWNFCIRLFTDDQCITWLSVDIWCLIGTAQWAVQRTATCL